MKKTYYLLFYKLNNFFKYVHDDSWTTWKALIVICVAEGFLMLEPFIWYDVIWPGPSSPTENSKAKLFIPALILVGLNYWILMHNDKWKVYEEEFKNHSRRKKIISSWLTFLFIIGVLTSLILAFYNLSLIDWATINKDNYYP
jgi:hypothetical protein